MNQVFVAGQDQETREWIPVAFVAETDGIFLLGYTQGARRLPNFVGFGRMQQFNHVYYSRQLFPFFANRLISKARREYSMLADWLDIPNVEEDPLTALAISGGVRSTDSFEIVQCPPIVDRKLTLKFFPRGLRYIPLEHLAAIGRLSPKARLFLMHDVQNSKDTNALLLRSESPMALVGYVPKYYSPAVRQLLTLNRELLVTVHRLNGAAPLDMRILCKLEAEVPAGFSLFGDQSDFAPIAPEPQLTEVDSDFGDSLG